MQLVCPSCLAKNRVPDARLHDQPVCGRCGTSLMAPEPVNLGSANFDAFVQGTGLPVVIDFWAAWCGPCKMMAPSFAEAARLFPDVRFAKVDTEVNQQIALRYLIRSIPTLILFRDGLEIARQSGALSTTALQDWIGRSLRNSKPDR